MVSHGEFLSSKEVERNRDVGPSYSRSNLYSFRSGVIKYTERVFSKTALVSTDSLVEESVIVVRKRLVNETLSRWRFDGSGVLRDVYPETIDGEGGFFRVKEVRVWFRGLRKVSRYSGDCYRGWDHRVLLWTFHTPDPR